MSNDITRPLALVILDGWGISPNANGNALASAHTPYYDEVRSRFPRTALAAAGSRVGLADGSPGNADAGHLTIGAGRAVRNEVGVISDAIASGEFGDNPVLTSAYERAARTGSAVHLIGLVSDANVHSSTDALFALLRMAKQKSLTDVFVHAILDGRDVQPRTADIYVDAVEIKMDDIGAGKIATLCGRHYAMDCAENWERTARAYTMLVHGEGERGLDAVTAIRASFLRGIADEFIAPIVIEKRIDEPVARVKNGDLVIYFNHKPEEMRQLVRFLSVSDPAAVKPMVDTVCLVECDRSFNLPVAFAPPDEQNILAQVFMQHGVRNYRITETSRALHLSRHFNCNADSQGGRETYIVVPDGGPQSLESEPESRSFKIADRLLRTIESDSRSVFVVNFPAPDLLADTGNFEKTVEAVQYVDTCLGGVLEKVREIHGVALITSSHSNLEEVIDPTVRASRPAKSSNPVPLHLVDYDVTGTRLADGGSLADVAPTILGILGIDKPSEMTGNDLRIF